DVWKSGGYHPVPLETAGIPQGLLSGTIDAVPMPPFFALAGQLDGTLKYMLELNWAPLVGTAVVRTKSWDRVPPSAREAMLKIASEVGKKATADGRRTREPAAGAMARRALHVH